MSALDNPQSAQLKLVSEWSRGFKEGKIDLIEKHLHKDFRHRTYPRSLGLPEQKREECLVHFAQVINFSTNFESTNHSVIEMPGKVILHATNDIKNALGVNTTRESIYIMHIVSDGTGTLKLKRIDEFTDSKAYLDIIQAVARQQVISAKL